MIFQIGIVSELFEGMELLDRHKLVNQTLKEEIDNLHAVTIITKTPQQYKLSGISF